MKTDITQIIIVMGLYIKAVIGIVKKGLAS